jgi:ArsR family transcriptional regulator
MADETRIRIIRLMVMSGEEVCLCEITDSLNEPQTKLSRHLKVLRQAGLLSALKEGRWLYHRLITGESHLDHLYAIIKSLPDPDKLYETDLANFKVRLGLREGARCKTEQVIMAMRKLR